MTRATAETYPELLAAVKRGEGLPLAWYTDPAITDREITDILQRSWQYIGPLQQLRNVGDYITGMVGRVPVAVVRNAEGLTGLVNVCRHRRHVVLKDRGNARVLKCGYHAWVYDLNGCLKGAPRSEEDPDFRVEDYPLLPIRAEAVGPFVFVNLDPNAKPAHHYYGRVLDLLGQSGIDLNGLVLYSREEWEAYANWKTMLENFLECYHCAVAHPGFSAAIDVKPENYLLTHEDWFSSQIGRVRDSALEGKSQVKIYDASGEIGEAQYHLLWPNLTININPGFPNLSLDVWVPNGPHATKGFSEQYFAPGVSKEFAEELIEFNRQVGLEDDVLTDSVQWGLRSGLPTKARFLPKAEHLAIHFQTLVLGALSGEGGAPEPAVEAVPQNGYLPFEVAKVERESDVISSFYLRRADGQPVAPALPGQFLPIRVTLPGQARAVSRTYTISDVPDAQHYRLSIKREGREASVSTFLHDHAGPGFRLEAMSPRGKFILNENDARPVALVSAGVGITPMIAMLNHLAARGLGRRVYFVHGARNGAEHAFGPHVRDLAARHPDLSVHVRYSEPRAEDQSGAAHDSVGRIDAGLLRQLLPLEACDIYLCGPTAFMQANYDGLIAEGVPADRIRFESFGSGGLSLKPSVHAASAALPPVTVRFERSGVTKEWRPEHGTLLEFAETLGIAPVFGCRSGVCGSCATGLKGGSVKYAEEPVAAPDDGVVLLCCSTPAPSAAETGLTLDL